MPNQDRVSGFSGQLGASPVAHSATLSATLFEGLLMTRRTGDKDRCQPDAATTAREPQWHHVMEDASLLWRGNQICVASGHNRYLFMLIQVY